MATVALYTPFESPAAACNCSCAGPVPERGETVSQDDARLAGRTCAVHCGVPPVKLRFTVALAVCEELTAERLTEEGDTENAAGFATGPANVTGTDGVTSPPASPRAVRL
jgi:hypothetical protein